MNNLLLGASLLAAAGSAAADPAAARARAFIDAWGRRDYASMHGFLTAQNQKKWPRSQFDSFWGHLEPPLKVLDETTAVLASRTEYHAEYIDSEFVMRLDLSFDQQLGIERLLLTSDGTKLSYPSPHEKDVAAYRFRFPFAAGAGTWTAFTTNHRHSRAQRFAYDMMIYKDGKTWSGDERDNSSYFAYGSAVLAPAGGTVIEVHDGEPDNAPPQTCPDVPGGNSVLIKVADHLYLFMAHMIPGSVAVAAGATVSEGQIVGKVGNSGNSSEPHLHIDISDALPHETADGYPLYFYDVIRNGSPEGRALAQDHDTLAAEGTP